MIGTFLRKALYGFLGNLAAMFTNAVTDFTPQGDAIDVYIWQGIGVAWFTGLAGLLSRLIRKRPPVA